MGVIYIAVNVRNGAMYVGKTVQRFERRKQAHKIGSEKANTHFYKAIRKYGWDSFSWVVIDEVSNDELNAAEMEYIAYYKDIGKHLYNETLGGDGTLGYAVSDETKQKMSLSRKGNKNSLGYKQTKETVSGKSKTYKLISSNGETIKITNMRDFCRVNGYDRRGMMRLLQGTQKSAYGYTLA